MKRGQYILALVALAEACSSGGLVGSLPVVPDPAQAATVVVMRQYLFEGSAVAPTVTIDGLETYELGVNEHVAIPVGPGDRLVGLLLRRSLSADERATVRIHADAGRGRGARNHGHDEGDSEVRSHNYAQIVLPSDTRWPTRRAGYKACARAAERDPARWVVQLNQS